MFDATEYIKEARFAADGIHLAPESGHRVCDAISEALSSHGASPGGSASADEDEGGDGIVNSCFYVCIHEYIRGPGGLGSPPPCPLRVSGHQEQFFGTPKMTPFLAPFWSNFGSQNDPIFLSFSLSFSLSLSFPLIFLNISFTFLSHPLLGILQDRRSKNCCQVLACARSSYKATWQ